MRFSILPVGIGIVTSICQGNVFPLHPAGRCVQCWFVSVLQEQPPVCTWLDVLAPSNTTSESGPSRAGIEELCAWNSLGRRSALLTRHFPKSFYHGLPGWQ